MGDMSETVDGLFDGLESNVRSYCRQFPALFVEARGNRLWDVEGREYLDFISGAGALNYGHNDPVVKRALVDYLESDGPVQSLDLHTIAKAEFLRRFRDIVLIPRGLDYRVQFTGPTGANSVESAFKVARKATGRSNIVAFTNGFHGGSLGALAASANLGKRRAGGVTHSQVTHVPYEGYLDGTFDTMAYLAAVLDDPGSGVEKPAAIVVETVQGEGGLAAASVAWLRGLAEVARSRDILLIVDDIQAGCGRTGRFFSFEEAGIVPDIVCLAKSISGYGLPMALTLIRPEIDVLAPGEHAGTFRGHNLAFVAAAASLERWSRPEFQRDLDRLCREFDAALTGFAAKFADLGCVPRGRGMFRGLSFADNRVPARISRAAFEAGLLLETSGAWAQTLKIMPPIVLDPGELRVGLDRLAEVVHTAGHEG
jgi:diaminobutyrate-2-oxoglutarate transaminase